LEAEVWLARKLASLTRGLSPEGAGMVDAAVAVAIGGESAGRVLDLVRAKVVEADPAAHQGKVEAERRRRHATLTRVDEHGLRMIVARIDAGDAVWVDAMLERVAELLTARAVARGEQPASKDELRAEAMGWLARPAEVLQLLLEPVEPVEQEASRATALPVDVLDALRRVDPARLRPPATLYVHLHEAVVDGSVEPGAGVARVEGLGPHGMGQVVDLLRHTHVTVRPVIDLREAVSVNAYEHPARVAERVRLTRVGDYFPYASSTTRSTDLDHPTPYRANGPPGQTGTHNPGPLTRRHHRLKTHAGFTARQTAPGCYVWRTPRGQYRLVDPHGTHPIAPGIGETMLRGSEVELRVARGCLGDS